MLFDADNDRLGLVSGYKHEIMGAVRKHDRLLRDALPPAPTPPRIGEGTNDTLAWLSIDEARMAELKGRGSRRLARRELRGSLVTRASFEADVGTRGCWSVSVMGGGFRA